MRQSTRLILNTAATYIRMGVTVVLGLIVIRVLLKQLGVHDYGLLTVIGATGSFLGLLSGALSSSGDRHLAHEIGRGDSLKLQIVFATLMGLFLLATIVVILVGLSLRSTVLSALTIPAGRDHTAIWLYNITLAGIAISFATTPYQSALVAHQELIIRSLYDLVSRILELLLVLGLMIFSGDKVILYAIGLVAIQATLNTFIVVYCLFRFAETRWKPSLFSRGQVGAIGGYAFWQVFGAAGGILRDQGGVILLNTYFGTATNAAGALVLRLQGYTDQLALGLSAAIRPSMATLEGRGATKDFQHLVIVGCKYPLLAMLFVAVPLFLEPRLVLNIWLGEYPPEAAFFVQLMLIMRVMGIATWGHQMAAQAKGKIAGITLWMVVPFAVLLAFLGIAFSFTTLPSYTLYLANLLVTTAIALIIVPWRYGRVIDIPARHWWAEAMRPVAFAAAPGLFVAVVCRLMLPESIWRLVVITTVFVVLTIPAIWLLACTPEEQDHFRRVFGAVLQRIRPRSKVLS